MMTRRYLPYEIDGPARKERPSALVVLRELAIFVVAVTLALLGAWFMDHP